MTLASSRPAQPSRPTGSYECTVYHRVLAKPDFIFTEQKGTGEEVVLALKPPVTRLQAGPARVGSGADKWADEREAEAQQATPSGQTARLE